MKLFEGNKLSLTLLFFIIVTISSCKKEIAESDFQYDEHELLKERDETSEFLIKKFRKGVDSSQIIWQSNSEDLNGDGINEKIKIVVLDENFFQKKENDEESYGAYLARVFINDLSEDIILNRSISNDSDYKVTFKIIDIDESDSFKELLVTQYEKEIEDPSAIHLIYRYFGRNLFTQTQITSSGYSGGVINFHDKEFEVIHNRNPETIGKYRLNKFFVENIEMSVGKESEIMAACPFVYVKKGNTFVYKGEIIRNLIGENSEATQSLDLGTSESEELIIRIKEEKKETSYINYIAIQCNDKIVLPIKTKNNKELLLDDNSYLTLKKGNYIDLVFNVTKNSKITLIGKGYYIPN